MIISHQVFLSFFLTLIAGDLSKEARFHCNINSSSPENNCAETCRHQTCNGQSSHTVQCHSNLLAIDREKTICDCFCCCSFWFSASETLEGRQRKTEREGKYVWQSIFGSPSLSKTADFRARQNLSLWAVGNSNRCLGRRWSSSLLACWPNNSHNCGKKKKWRFSKWRRCWVEV